MPIDPVPAPPSIFFGEDFELDLRACQLLRSGRGVKLERIPTGILLLLVERRGQLVSREEIAERIWGKDACLDIDNSINGAIRKIRQVLRDNPEEPRFVQTVTGRGYRFIAEVRENRDTPMEATPPPPVPPPGVLPSGSRRWALAGLTLRVAIALVVLSGTAAMVWSRSRAPHAGAGRVMLAVLPFQNLTGDSGQNYLSEGLTEEMITQLGSRDPARLAVIARASVMHYQNRQSQLSEIESQLGVQYLLLGSVRRDASGVRVSAQLVHATDQTQIWAGQFDRSPGETLALEGEIAGKIADAIESALGGPRAAASTPAARPGSGDEAYDLYLKGEYLLDKRTIPDLRTAIGYLREAVARDSAYARAYAALADAYTLFAGYNVEPSAALLSEARAAALKALALDPDLPEAHTALALVVENHDWDWRTAEQEFRRAIELNPNYATAHHWYSECLMWQGRFDEALRESERARELDPLSLIIAADNGAILYYSRQYDRAIAKWRSVLDIDPDFGRAHLIVAAYADKGMVAAALADLERWRAPTRPPVYWAWVAYIHGRAGQAAQARRALHELIRASRRAPIQAGAVAAAYAAAGDREQALAWLEKDYAERSNDMVNLKVNPAYDGLRSDPRFQRLLSRVGLSQ